METEGILNRKVDKAAQQPSHSQENDPHQGTLMVNRMEGLSVEKPLHGGKKGPKKARFGVRRGQRGRRKERKERRRRRQERKERKERKGRRRRRPGTKKRTAAPAWYVPSGIHFGSDCPPTCPRAASLRRPPKNRCRRSIGASRPSAKRRTDYLPSNCFTSAATVTPL